jgi:glutamate racemase
MDNRPIGIFDSGIGGLSVAQKIWQFLPHEATIYLADHQYCPYGNKSKQLIQSRIIKAVNFLRQQQVKLIVIACNTATVISLQLLREKFALPFVGVVPAIKPAVASSQTGSVIVLSTSQTAASDYQQQLKHQFDQHDRVVSFACSGLVKDIEQFADQPAKMRRSLKQQLQPIVIKKDCAAVVLGCTHYILVKDILRRLLPRSVKLIEPSQAVARRTAAVLSAQQLSASDQNQPARQFFTTANSAKVSSIASALLKKRIIFTPCSW